MKKIKVLKRMLMSWFSPKLPSDSAERKRMQMFTLSAGSGGMSNTHIEVKDGKNGKGIV